jgi:hypothetical protein
MEIGFSHNRGNFLHLFISENILKIFFSRAAGPEKLKFA